MALLVKPDSLLSGNILLYSPWESCSLFKCYVATLWVCIQKQRDLSSHSHLLRSNHPCLARVRVSTQSLEAFSAQSVAYRAENTHWTHSWTFLLLTKSLIFGSAPTEHLYEHLQRVLRVHVCVPPASAKTIRRAEHKSIALASPLSLSSTLKA